MGYKERYEERRKKNTSVKPQSTQENKGSYKERYLTRQKKREYENIINFDTFQTDLSSMGKTIGDVYGGWQTQETMNNTRASVESMQSRINAYQEYRKLFGNDDTPDLSELATNYGEALGNWDKLSKGYSSYKNADEYKVASERRASLPTADVKALETEISSLEDILSKAKEYETEIGNLKVKENVWSHRGNGLKTDVGIGEKVSAKEKEYSKFLKESGYSSVNELKKAIQEKTEYKDEAKGVQEFRKTYPNISYKAIGEIANIIENSGELNRKELKEKVNSYIETLNLPEAEYNDTQKYANFITDAPRDPNSFWQGTFHSLGYLGEKTLAGALGFIENTGDYLGAGATWLGSKLTWGGVSEKLEDASEFFLERKSTPELWSENLETRYRVPDAVRYLGQTAEAAGNLAIPMATEALTLGASPLGDIALSQQAVTGGAKILNTAKQATKASDVLFGLSAAGGAAKQGYDISGDIGKSLSYGALTGLGEVATEKIFGGFAGTDIGDSLIDFTVNNKAIRKLLNFGTEGVEEMMMAGADTILQRATVDKEAALPTIKELGESGMQGVLLSLFMGAATYPINKHNKNKAIKEINAVTDGFNEMIANEADKFVPLKKSATEEEIKQRQEEIKKKTLAYREAVEKAVTEGYVSMELIGTADKDYRDGVIAEGLKSAEDTESYKLALEYNAKVAKGEELSWEEMEKLSKANEKAFKIEEKIAGMSEEDANLFREQYDGSVDLEEFTDSFNLVSTLSENDFLQSHILKNRGVLTPAQVGDIYKAKVRYSYEALQTTLDNLKLNHKVNTFVEGKFDGSIIDMDSKTTDGSKVNWKDLSPKQQKAIKFAELFSKATGINIKLIKSDVVNGVHKGKNGSYDAAKNLIELDVYAGRIDASLAEDAIIPTLSHEVTHWMKYKAPALYRAIREEILPILEQKEKGNGIIAKEMKRLKESHPNMDFTSEDAIDELIARACEDMLSGNVGRLNSIFEKVGEKERQGFVAKVKEIFENLIEWVNKLLSQYKSSSDEAKTLREVKGQFEKIAKQWGDMLVSSIEANQALQKEGITGEALAKAENNIGVKNSFRDSISGRANDLLLPYDEELTRLIEQRGDYIVDSFEKLKEIVNLAFDVPQLKSTAYFGIIPSEVLSKIEKSIPNIPKELNGTIFKPNKAYSVAATLDSIRHLADEKKLSRNDIIEYLDRMADTIVEFDTVYFDYYYQPGQKSKGINFKKQFSDGTIRSFEIVSNKKRSLNLQTFYMESGDYIKKKSAETLLMDNPSADAQGEGRSNFEDIITQEDTKSQEKNSDKDNLGNALSEGQQSYFADSKVRDENGNLLVMYRGDADDFTVFDRKKSKYSNLYGRGFYFTKSKAHAEQYGKAREFYLDIKNPLSPGQNAITKEQMLKFLKAIENDGEDYGLYNYGEGATAESVLNSVWGKGDFAMLQDISAGAIGDLVAAIELFNEVNGTSYDGVILPTETVTFNSEQAKLTSNKNPTKNKDIKFSMREKVEETKELVAVHNMRVSELERTLDLGGLPMPSIAIIKAESGHSEYGDVSLVFPKSTIDPKANRNNKVYGGDAWTPVYPTIEYKPNEKVAKKINDKYYEFSRKFGYDESRPLYKYVYEMEDVLNRHKGEAEMIAELYEDEQMMQVYLLDTGKSKVETIKKETRTELTDEDVKMREFFIAELGADVVDEVMWDGNGTPMAYRKNYLSKYGDAIRDAYKKLLSKEYHFTDEQVQNVMDSTSSFDLARFMRDAHMYRENGRVTTKTEDDFKATKEAIKEVAGEDYRKWVDSLFKGIEEKAGIRNNTDPFTNSGNRRSWEALHWENNLENVVKVMKSQDNGQTFFGGQAIWSVSAKDYSSVNEIKADSNRLMTMDKEQYDAIKESFGDRFNEIAHSMMDKTESNYFIALDNAMECVVDALRHSKTKSGILNYLKQFKHLTVTETNVDDIVSLVTDISNMPTEYFEAKPKRAVELNEIATAIIPDSTSEDTKARLDDMGIKYLEYESGNEDARLKALNSLEDVKFSDRDSEGNTLTKEQQEFFKDSKVRDAEGNLLVVYHGTNLKRRFFKFDTKQNVAWFTRSSGYADVFSRGEDKNIIYKTYLNIKNPLYLGNIDGVANEENLKYLAAISKVDISELKKILKDEKGEHIWKITNSKRFKELVKKQGYDGYTAREGGVSSWAIFNAEQAKDVKNYYPSNDADIRYSDRPTETIYDKMGETERVKKENEILKADLDRLTERLKLERQVTKGDRYDKRKLEMIAGHLRNIAKSTTSNETLVPMLEELFGYASRLDDPDSYNGIQRRLNGVAEALLAEAKPETISDAYAKLILRDIRGKGIKLTETQVQEAKHLYGENYRNAFWGKVIIAKDGMSLDSKWQEWASKYPAYFDANVTEGDQVGALLDIYNGLRDLSETLVEYDRAEVTRWLAREVLNQFWNLKPITTIADKYEKRIKEINFEHRKTMKKLRDDYADRMKKEKAEIRQKTAERLKELRDRKDAEIAEVKKLGKERLDKYKENAERKTVIQRITGNALTLNKWLTKNSKDYHIHEAMKGPVVKLLQAIDFSSKSQLLKGEPTQADVSFNEAFAEVKSMLENATNMVVGLEALYGHDLAEQIDLLSKATYRLVGDNNYIINAMSNEELQSLDKLVRHIKKVVSELNKFHTIHHNQGAVNLANEFMEHGERIGNLKKQHGKIGKFLEFRNKTPYYFFKHLGEAGKKVFEAFQDGWDKLSFNAKKIIDFAEETYTAKEVKQWSKETKEFTISQTHGGDRTFEMSIAQIMALHCVSKQEDAKTHLLSGGMTLKRLDKKGHVVADYENINLSITDIQSILETLTDRQREVADKLQEFMNTVCSAWGNEISMARFGVEMFGLPDYFPIKVSEATVPTDNTKDIDNASLFRLLNMSFAKSRNQYADQSIEVGDIFDIFAQHATDMAKYNALALPVLDFNKFYSIHGKDALNKEYGVVKTLKSAFGDEANGYLRRFVRDLNGSQNVSRDVVGNTFFKNAKLASVANNLRVVLLQPTAFYKASAVMDNKYLIKAGAYMKYEPVGMYNRFKKAVEKAEKYCGIVQWKSLGYYDTDISKGLTEKIKHADTFKDKAVELSLKGAEIADKVTFATLWTACEFEIRDTRKELKVGSKEYYDAVGKRLREVIYATQVVDSTMTRSDMMRSSDGRDKILTTFGSEPIIAYNMLLDAATQYNLDKKEFGKKEAKKKNGKKIRKVVTAYVITNVMAALVESGFDWLRDDDDEEMDMVEFMKTYLKNFAFDMSIGNKLPYIKEVYSALQGYSSSRMDTQWLQYLQYAFNSKKPVTGLKNLLKVFSQVSGYAFYNAYRDIMATLNKLDIFTTEDLEEFFDGFFD